MATGQDHLMKLLSFHRRISTGELSIGNFCLYVDSGGHTTILNRFLGDVKLSAITNDACGEASVQNLHPGCLKKINGQP
jgi:hypothetical protein